MRAEKGSWINAVFKSKRAGIFIIAVALGVALLLLPESKTESASEEKTVLTSAEYCTTLEQKAERLILELPEVSGCSVFITLEKGYRYIYASDQKVREGDGTKETEKTVVLASSGNGETAILVEEFMPTVAGVAVVCPNASYETQYRIVELMCALFDIKSNRISVKS